MISLCVLGALAYDCDRKTKVRNDKDLACSCRDPESPGCDCPILRVDEYVAVETVLFGNISQEALATQQ